MAEVNFDRRSYTLAALSREKKATLWQHFHQKKEVLPKCSFSDQLGGSNE
jgi:hypothetical protein